MQKIGIRYEDKYLMERRVALVPQHVRKLTEQGITVEVVRSPKRIFKDEEYGAAGAVLVDRMTGHEVVLGVKEMPMGYFHEGATYVFFSHTIKGQEYNMPLLKDMMDSGINLIDYERITDAEGRRLIFFGRFAGLAGMINTLWAAGQRWYEMGIETPFLKLKQTHHYGSLEEAREVVRAIGLAIEEEGLPAEISPFVVGITGYGNVSRGAQEILDLLPVVEITPEQLLQYSSGGYPDGKLFKVVFREEHLSEPIDAEQPFDLQDYYNYPEQFRSQFEQYLPFLTILMNCMYWDDRYPVIVSKDYLDGWWQSGVHKLIAIGDVTCDPDGSIECTHKGTEIEDPVFIYNPVTRQPTMGFKGEGLLVMAVDILPSELPRESSQTFSDALINYIPDLVKADFSVSFADLQVPEPLKRAMILYHGKLTPDYQYLEAYL